jgi:hypothetical protein
MAVQAKFGQYLQAAKDPMLISQTEKTVEWEQVSSNEQVLPMPAPEDPVFFWWNEKSVWSLNTESVTNFMDTPKQHTHLKIFLSNCTVF